MVFVGFYLCDLYNKIIADYPPSFAEDLRFMPLDEEI